MLAIRRRRIAFYFYLMNRYFSYLNSAKEILSVYDGVEPFASFIKKYFAKRKKYGSKDRKQVSHLCYCYFRLGKSFSDVPPEERILTAVFLCSSQSNEILLELRPAWNEKIHLTVEEKCSMVDTQGTLLKLFPFINELSEGIETKQFILSHLIQTDLFLRLRPGKEKIVKEKLQKAGFLFDEFTKSCIALPNSSGIDGIVELNTEAVVQDFSSQRVGELLLPVASGPLSVWDCCAASGGKSIMLYDLNPAIRLTVSDIRESILINLRKRFNEAGIKKYQSVKIDLTQSIPNFKHQTFDLIICDAPCSGSGTWGRTPEQLSYFDENRIDDYTSLQRKIVSNTVPHLKPGGHFLYVTCSVFKKENEGVVEIIEKDFGLNVIRMDVLKGYDKKADTMFAALLQKPL